MSNLYRDMNTLNKNENNELALWYQIYTRSNEDIFSLFSMLNLKDKDILTVLASSDYLFSSLVSNPKSIEAFDINPLTYRYYYLRKWLIENGKIDASNLGSKKMHGLINAYLKSNNMEERDSAYFWDYYLSNREFISLYNQTLFNFTPISRTIYDEKIDKLQDKLKVLNLNFYNININDNNINKKYDTILISNILDYFSKEELMDTRDKLNDLLKENGEIVCVQMHKYRVPLDKQKQLFSPLFKYQELFSKKSQYDHYITYYKYLKK